MSNKKESKPIENKNGSICFYGCENLANYISSSGNFICSKHYSSCPAVRKRNSESLKKRIESGDINLKERYKNLSEKSKQNMAWSKGLKKNKDPRLARPTLEGKLFGISLTGHTEETKKKISEARIKTLENSPHISWLILSNGIRVQGSWEYNVGETLISYGYELKRVRISYDGHRSYTPDFYLGDGIYVEVKGWLSERDKMKYRMVFKENPELKIYLIRNEGGHKNYDKFIKRLIKLEECEILKDVLNL